MELIKLPTWDEYLATMLDLLHTVATWFLTSFVGKPLLVLALVAIAYVLSAWFGKAEPLTEDVR